MKGMRTGFKSWCENTSKAYRRALGLKLDSALSSLDLAAHLGIVVWSPAQIAKLGGLTRDNLDQLLLHDKDSWSAATLIVPGRNIIIVNSSHSDGRQNFSIMHELAHLILDHKPARVDMTAARLMILDNYDQNQEREAEWFAGSLLVPRDGLLAVLRRDPEDESAAIHFGVSLPALQLRRQLTAVDAQLNG